MMGRVQEEFSFGRVRVGHTPIIFDQRPAVHGLPWQTRRNLCFHRRSCGRRRVDRTAKINTAGGCHAHACVGMLFTGELTRITPRFLTACEAVHFFALSKESQLAKLTMFVKQDSPCFSPKHNHRGHRDHREKKEGCVRTGVGRDGPYFLPVCQISTRCCYPSTLCVLCGRDGLWCRQSGIMWVRMSASVGMAPNPRLSLLPFTRRSSRRASTPIDPPRPAPRADRARPRVSSSRVRHGARSVRAAWRGTTSRTPATGNR